MTVVDFFIDIFFNDFEFLDFSEKGYWARCFGKSFGSSGGIREASWGIRRASEGGRGSEHSLLHYEHMYVGWVMDLTDEHGEEDSEDDACTTRGRAGSKTSAAATSPSATITARPTLTTNSQIKHARAYDDGHTPAARG